VPSPNGPVQDFRFGLLDCPLYNKPGFTFWPPGLEQYTTIAPIATNFFANGWPESLAHPSFFFFAHPFVFAKRCCTESGMCLI